MIKDWDPNVKSVIGILTIYLMKIQAVVHGLFNKLNVLIISNFEPIVEFLCNDTLIIKNVETKFRAHESECKYITLLE